MCGIFIDEKPHRSVFLYFYHLASSNSEYRKMNTQMRRTARERVEAVLHQGIESRVFPRPVGVKVSDLAHDIYNLLIGAVVVTFTEDPVRHREAAARTLKGVLAILERHGKDKN